jgi:hypothetical protein
MQLAELVDDDERREISRERAETILKEASARGGRTWGRDELHDRHALRDG